jgi:hypothetical protein
MVSWVGVHWCAVFASFVTLSACELPPEVTKATAYVGSVDDPDGAMSMGLAVQGTQVALFACSDDPKSGGYPGWLADDTYHGDGRIRLDHDGWSFVGALDSDGAQGTLIGPKGNVLQWSGRLAGGPSPGGLYSTFDSGCTTGVVVVDNGPTAPPTVRGAWCNSDGDVSQVIVAGSRLELVDGRLPVEVALDLGVRQFEVAPVQLPLAHR